jgi:hypothetical protein
MAATRTKKQYLLCVRNTGCEDLEPRKLYVHLHDPIAAEDGYVRVIDESGEDYLYPADYFVAVELPREGNAHSRAVCGELTSGRSRPA